MRLSVTQILECTVSLVHWTFKINLWFVSLGEAQGRGLGEGCKVWEGPFGKSLGSCSFAWMVLFWGSLPCSKGCVPVTISVQTAFLHLQVLHANLPNHCLVHRGQTTEPVFNSSFSMAWNTKGSTCLSAFKFLNSLLCCWGETIGMCARDLLL